MTAGLCSTVVQFQSPDRVNCAGYCIFTNDFQWMITALHACFFLCLSLPRPVLSYPITFFFFLNKNQAHKSPLGWGLKRLSGLINGMREACCL